MREWPNRTANRDVKEPLVKQDWGALARKENRDVSLAVYSAVASRRTAFDNLLW